MRSKSQTLLTLPEFADCGLLDPWHMAGFCVFEGKCDCARHIFPEHAWQGKWLSRAEVSKAIQQAEVMIAHELGYWPAPYAIVAEGHNYPTSASAPGMLTVKGSQYKSLKPAWGKVQQLGKVVETLVAPDAAVTLDAGKLRYRLNVALPGQPPEGAAWALYVSEEDRRGEPREAWEIRGFTASVHEEAGGYLLDIEGDAYWLLASDYRFARKVACANPDEAGSYLTTLEVWQRMVDETQQATLIWYKTDCYGQRCKEQRRAGCIELDGAPEYPLFRVKPAEWDTDAGRWKPYFIRRAPDRVEFHYIAGQPREHGRMHRPLAQAVFALAASMLRTDAAWCECDRPASTLLRELRDFERTTIATRDSNNVEIEYDERVMATRSQVDSPWGGRLGAVQAWRTIQAIKQSAWSGYGAGSR